MPPAKPNNKIISTTDNKDNISLPVSPDSMIVSLMVGGVKVVGDLFVLPRQSVCSIRRCSLG